MSLLKTTALAALMALTTAHPLEPTPAPPTYAPSVLTETWNIPTLAIHFMGANTGLPGNDWGNNGFNSTIDFTVSFPDATSATCAGNWTHTQVPTTNFECAGVAGVNFRLSPNGAGKLTETAFTLNLERVGGVHDEIGFAGSQEVRANSPGQANSYLTCLGGAPLDGIRCKLTGFGSTAGPLKIAAAAF